MLLVAAEEPEIAVRVMVPDVRGTTAGQVAREVCDGNLSAQLI